MALGRPKKLPAIQFYTGDWMKDHALRACSLEARGLWMDMLCLMHDSSMRGHLILAEGIAMDNTQLARISGTTPEAVDTLTEELERTGVVSRGAAGEFVSRRMVRDEATRQALSEGGRKGGLQSAAKRNGGSSTSTSASTSTSISKKQELENDMRSHNIDCIVNGVENTSVAGENKVSASLYYLANSNREVQKVMEAIPRNRKRQVKQTTVRIFEILSNDELQRAMPAEFLAKRIKAYYESEEGCGQFYRGPLRWLEEGGYDEPDEAWHNRETNTEL